MRPRLAPILLAVILLAALALGLVPASGVLAADADRPPNGSEKPWLADVAYDTHALDKLDVYRPLSTDTVPVVVFIHGGGWFNGDKSYVPREDVAYFTSRNIAFVAINYRNVPSAQQDGLYPPVLGPLQDAKRALQFVRYHAKDFAIDPARVALFGESAGAFDVLWLGLAPDRAKPKSIDPTDRMSTRVKAIGTIDAQTSIDPQQMRRWVGPRLNYGSHAFGLDAAAFTQFLARRNEYKKYFPILSPAEIVNQASPPTFLYYTREKDGSATDPMYYVHSPDFGTGFLQVAEERRADVTLRIGDKGHPNGRDELLAFLAKALQ